MSTGVMVTFVEGDQFEAVKPDHANCTGSCSFPLLVQWDKWSLSLDDHLQQQLPTRLRAFKTNYELMVAWVVLGADIIFTSMSFFFLE